MGRDDAPRPPVTGVCPVLETPFTGDGAVDEAGFVALTGHVIACGVRSVRFPGFASEFHKLTDDERTRLTAILLGRTSKSAVSAVISVPDHATRVAVAHARHAVEAGADVISVLPPHFLGPSRAAVRDHVGAVADAVAPAPVVLQYAPRRRRAPRWTRRRSRRWRGHIPTCGRSRPNPLPRAR